MPGSRAIRRPGAEPQFRTAPGAPDSPGRTRRAAVGPARFQTSYGMQDNGIPDPPGFPDTTIFAALSAAGISNRYFYSDVPVSALWGQPGLAIAVGLSTLVIAGGLMATIGWRTLAIAADGLARLALAVGAATAFAFGAPSLALSPVAAALLGLAVYALIVVALRPLGLSAAWAYVRGLN